MKSEPPACLGPRPIGARPTLQAPRGGWDTQFHVFGPPERFPYAPTRRYSPPTATLEQYLALLDHLGLERAVCVHPNTHGTDNAVTLDAIRRSQGRVVGVVKLDETANISTLRAMHREGIRGVRFAFNPHHGGTFDEALFRRVAGWAGDLGWSVAIHCAPEDLVRLADLLARAPAHVVVDHMGRVDPAQGLEQEPFRTLLDLARLAHVWVRISGADRISRFGSPFTDVTHLARALVEAAPDRIVWGTDWPHSGYFDQTRMPDDAELLDLLLAWVPDEVARRRILVDSPSRLFGG